LATWEEDGELDLDRVLETLAAIRPLTKIPHRPMFSLRRGVQLLIDTGLSMAPFRTDVERITGQIGGVLGDHRIDCRYFRGCPSRGCIVRGKQKSSAWQAPPRGIPVAAITDLGIGGPLISDERAGVDEWEKFARSVLVGGSPLVALVPYAADRWPRRLDGLMRLIHWDQKVTAAAIRRRVTRRGALGN
jgi:hypothetical protein